MSIEARRKYLTAVWERYGKAKRAEKTAILNEYVRPLTIGLVNKLS